MYNRNALIFLFLNINFNFIESNNLQNVPSVINVIKGEFKSRSQENVLERCWIFLYYNSIFTELKIHVENKVIILFYKSLNKLQSSW